jgi:hypothetical protein
VHVLLAQVAVWWATDVVHGAPHDPQLALSFAKSAHPPLHELYGATHEKPPHWLLTQVGFAWLTDVLHIVPHIPQFWASLDVFVHVVPQSIWPVPQPLVQP